MLVTNYSKLNCNDRERDRDKHGKRAQVKKNNKYYLPFPPSRLLPIFAPGLSRMVI